MLKITLCKTYAEALAMAGKRASEFGKKPSSNRLYAFCEDKLSMSLEREIASTCGGGTFNVRVMTFSRFIHNHTAKKTEMLDKESSAMVVKNILLKKAAELSCFHKSAYNPGTAVTLYELIAQLKSAMVEPKDLKEGMLSLGGALKGKISDIATVYEEYESYVKNKGYYDSNSYLALMNDLLKEGNFKGSSAMLVCFGSLTRQGVEILKTLVSVMENVDVFLLAGENGELYTNELKELIMHEIGGFCVVNGEFTYEKERLSIMENLFEPTYIKAQKTETDKVFYYEAVDCVDEISHVASIIRREVINGVRYRDIAIAVGNPAGYKGVISRVFSSYGIPYFLDDARILTSHPIARLVVEYLDMLRGNYRLRDCITFEKNPYFQKDKDVSDRFENFCLKNALTPKNIKSGLYPTKNDQETYGEDVETYESERMRLVQLHAYCFTVEGFVEAVKGMLENLGVREEAEVQAKKLKDYGDLAGSAFTLQAYEKTVGVLDSVLRILGDNRVSIADFRNILISGFTACKVSVLPQLSDAVYIGDYKECKYLEHKILFAGGLSGEVPFTKSDTAVLTDRDLSELENFNCIVEPKIRIVNKRERENVGMALLSFTDKLYLSRSATGGDGKPLSKSRVIDNVLSLFTKNGKPLQTYTATRIKKEIERSQNLYRQVSAMRFNAPRPSMMEFISGAAEFKAGAKPTFLAETAYFSVLRDSMPDECEKIEGLLASGGSTVTTYLEGNGDLVFKDGTLSATILETYFGCPFACFMQHGLKVEERETGDVKVNEFGSFLHDVLEHYVGEIKRGIESGDERITDRATSDAFVDGLIENLSQDHRYSRYLDTEKYKTVFALIGKEARRVAYAIFTQFKNSSFRPVATEASFGDGAKYPAIKLSTSHGEKKIKGKIDRVDRFGDYVRIIDYKTGKTHEDDESFYTGNNLQLYLYMNAFLGKNDKPCGAYYFPVSDKFGEENEYIYAVRGKTLLSDDVVRATDHSVSESSPESQVLNVKFSYKGGSISARSKAVLDELHFKAYVDYALMIAKKGAEEIEEGVIAPSPYENKCTYCKYAPVCGFDVASGVMRKEKGVNEGTVFDAVEVENGLHK